MSKRKGWMHDLAGKRQEKGGRRDKRVKCVSCGNEKSQNQFPKATTSGGKRGLDICNRCRAKKPKEVIEQLEQVSNENFISPEKIQNPHQSTYFFM